MKVLSFKDFIQKYKLKNDTIKESEFQRVYIFRYILEIQKYILRKGLLI